MRNRFYLNIIMFTVIFFVSCASQRYSFIPAEHQASASRIRNEAIYSIPEKSPTGIVRILSLGVKEIESEKGGDKTPALLLRIALSNHGENTNEILDIRDQFVSFSNAGSSEVLFSNFDHQLLPRLEVKPGELRALDLYFKLPPFMKSESDIPEFDFHWKIQIGHEKISKVTPFDRIPIPDYYYGPNYYPPYFYPYGWGWGYALGWSPFGWSSPFAYP